MKLLYSSVSILLLVVLCSCGEGKSNEKKTNAESDSNSDTLKTEKKEEIFIPEILKGSITKTLTAGETSESSRIYFEYFKIEEKSPVYLKSVNELISRAVQSDFEEPEEEKITPNLTKKYFADILTEFKKSFLNIEEEFMPWSMMDSIHIDDSKSDYAHLEIFTYSFTGGAHGNGNESHYLINKKTGKTLTLSDVFKNKKKINSLVDQYFRKSQGLSMNENLQDAGWFIEGRLTANENFYFTEKKVVFVYNPYEIGPYAAGAPSVEIPLSKLEDLLILNLK
jgi:hypothetical protein